MFCALTFVVVISIVFVVGASFTFLMKKSMIKNTKHLYGQIVDGVSSGYAVRVG